MKKILVIVDCQNDFISGSLGSDAAKSRIDNICKKIENFSDGLIITTQDTHDPDYLETKEGQSLPVEHCIRFSMGWGLDVNVSSTIISKCAFDKSVTYTGVEKPTFGSTKLMEVIENYVGDEEFEITFIGFVTSICVCSNVLMTKAIFYRNANIIVDSQCCADITEEKHNAALEVMKSCQITIKNE